MRKWLMSNGRAWVAATALTVALTAGLFVTIAQVRCTLLEEDVARLKGRLNEEAEGLKAEQETNHKAVLGVVTETVKRLADHLAEEAGEAPDTPAEVTPNVETPKAEPEGGVE